MDSKLEYKLKQLNDALSDFRQSLGISFQSLPDGIIDTLKSGQVQKFEFTIELLWKTIKFFLNEIHGFDENSPKSVIKRFFLAKYINESEYESLIDALNDRNRLSHIYNKEQFEKIYSHLGKYAQTIQTSFDRMKP